LPTEGVNEGRKIILSAIIITNSKVQRGSSFKDLFFLKPVSFENTVFEDDVSFDGSAFAQPPIFTNVCFKGDVSFEKSEFFEGVSFIGSIFKNDARFMGADFKKSARFEGADFSGTAAFMDAHFRKAAKFTKSIFSRDADFSKTLFDEDVYFDGARFKSEFNLFSRFRGKLVLSADYANMNINWEDIKFHLVHEEITYKYLINNFKKQGCFDNADNCYYQYRQWMQKRRIDIFKKFTDSFYHSTCGYGVRPSFTLIWILGLITFFAILYNGFGGVGYQIDPNSSSLSISTSKLSFLNCIPYSTLVFIGQIA
jgi:hypothetical protein